jgi:hypothetical protein
MGYRSDWQLGIISSTEDKLEEVRTWMIDYTADTANGEDERNIMQYIIDSERETEDTFVSFGDEGYKCYDPWDSVIQDIKCYVNTDDELDYGYARIGEELEDIETDCGDGNCMPSIVRSFDGFDRSNIACWTLPSKSDDEEEVVEAEMEAPIEVETETCTSCGKNKDVGYKCWWCGN